MVAVNETSNVNNTYDALLMIFIALQQLVLIEG